MNDEKRTILIVDDHGPTLEKWKALLEQQNLKVLTAINGQNAYELAHERQPDLILSDLDMPQVDGFQLLTLLKKANETKEIPVIIFSGTTDVTSKLLAIHMGAIAYLEKPLDSDELLDTIQKKCGLTVAVATP